MISVTKVTKTYRGAATALRDVSVDIADGEFAFLIGASGSGKSTFMRLLMRELRPDSGSITVAGVSLDKLPGRRVPRLRRRLGCVFQDFRLLDNKTVSENVAYALQVIGAPSGEIRERVPETLRLVGLEKKASRRPHELSGGEQQRVAVARALVNRPAVLLADEPTGNLDPDTGEEIVMLLERINARGTTVLMATHDSNVVDRSRRHVIELVGGKVARDDVRGTYGVSR